MEVCDEASFAEVGEVVVLGGDPFGPGCRGRGRAAGVCVTQARRWFREAGGVAPAVSCPRPAGYRRVSFAEREDIAIWRAEGVGVRQIAARLGRSPGTVGA